MLVKMVSEDPRSPTCKNLRYLKESTGLDQPESYSSWRMREKLPAQNVPEMDKWRLGLLSKLMEMRQVRFMQIQDSKQITAMIESLCST